MAHVLYPSSFPTDCVSALIQIARGGKDELIARRAEVGAHVWNIQGFAQSVFLGNPDAPFAASSGETGDIGERVNELNAACMAASGDTSFAAAKLDWRAALKFFLENVLPYLLPLILKDE